MYGAYVSTLPGPMVGAIGGSLAVVGLSLVVGLVIATGALLLGGVVQQLFVSGGRARRRLRLVEVRGGMAASQHAA
ncbi:MAG TPA: hypothetical protein VKA21_13330 [Candidatus Binatia bacterium]|nr:hypothetical protein [Candidatus Binatia bacterium]